MNSTTIKAVLFFFVALTIGLTLQQDPFQLKAIAHPEDQKVLDFRDSPYSHISWVASDSGNYAQLRFFDKVEGGVCLRPTWAELQELALSKPDLAHLIPKTAVSVPENIANPGTLSNTRYVCLYPSSILLNNSLIQRANGDARQAPANVLVVGLGSGVGISVLAHHFPEASITVVDIDQTVIDMVVDHYPFIASLQNEQTSDGRPRLILDAADARQYITYEDMRRDPLTRYDVVVLDAYTSGSTIPSHLMTKEFFVSIAAILNPDGILMSNIIGSYTGKKRYVLGGAMRSMQAAGLDQVINIPIMTPGYIGSIDVNDTRNNIVLASKAPLTPDRNSHGWKRMEAFTPWNELPTGAYETANVVLIQGQQFDSSALAIPTGPLRETLIENAIDARNAELSSLLDKRTRLLDTGDKQGVKQLDRVIPIMKNNGVLSQRITDEKTSKEILETLKKEHEDALNWFPVKDRTLYFRYTDWVEFTRQTYKLSLIEGRSQARGVWQHSADTIVGSATATKRDRTTIFDAPIFTDAQPNADILNR